MSHSLRSFYPDQIEAACHDDLRRAAQAQTEGLRVALEHPVLGVEAMEVVGDADRIGRDRVRAAPLGRLGSDPGQLEEAPDQALLVGGSSGGGDPPTGASPAFLKIPAIRAWTYWT